MPELSTVPPTYKHGLKIKRYKSRRRRWRYVPTPHWERRNQFRRARNRRNRNIQTTSRDYFRFHFILLTDDLLVSIQRHKLPSEDQEQSLIALLINTPEATDTASARIYSVYIVNKDELYPSIVAEIA